MENTFFKECGLPEKYIFTGEAGTGGQKKIFICRDSQTQRSVAVAVPLKNSEKGNASFLEEAILTGQLEHPNIIPVHEIGTTASGRPYFVMKLASGLSLSTILKRLRELDPEFSKDYPLHRLITIFLKAATGIAFAHSQGICHLDLKPANIQVGDYGEVQVLDWGLARHFTQTARIQDQQPEDTPYAEDIDKTLNGIVKGTPEYMAPEQALGLNNSRGPRSDIYSLGAILYAILTFHAPVTGQNSTEVIDNAAMGRLIMPIRHSASRKYSQVLMFIAFKAMDRAPSHRYKSVEEMIQDIRAYQNGYPTLAENAGIFTRFILMMKRRRLQMFLAVSLFFILLMLIAFLAGKLYYKDLEIHYYQMENISDSYK